MAWFGDFRERPARDSATSPSVNLPSPSTTNGTAPPTVAASNGGSGIPLQEINFAILSLLVIVVLFFMLLLCFKSRRRARRAAVGGAGGLAIHSVTGGRSATVATTAADLLPAVEHGGLLMDAAARGSGGGLGAKVAFSLEEIAKLGPVQRYKPGLFDGDSGKEEEEEAVPKDEEMGEAQVGSRHGHGHGQGHGHGCAVCLGEYEVGENVRRLLACSHAFHQECIDAWLLAKTSCPLCRCCLLQRSPLPSPGGAQPGSDNTAGLAAAGGSGDAPGDNAQSQRQEASGGVSGTAPQRQTAHGGQANVLPRQTPAAPLHWWQLRWLLPSS